MAADRFDHRAFDRRTHQVDHFSRRFDTTQRGLAHLVTTGKHHEQHLIEIFERQRLNALHGGHTQHHLVALTLAKKFQNIGGLVEIEMYQNCRGNLRMLIAQQLSHAGRFHPLQALNAGDIAALQNAVDQQSRLVVAQRAFEHRAHVIARIGHQQTLRRRHASELVHHFVDPFTGHRFGLGNGLAQFLDFLG
ncbi:hypothetical protein GALL_481650 [mine drainage metagenome]|uniref:Uncharacterized protein n=1 Tax=mine drainage metagenome TaxID=410659 RepID=A0A1J5PHG4_9ZZZZ